jgi:hypothetical protein
MLQAAWRRETGEDLTERLENLGRRAVMKIEFDLAAERDWMAWPKVRLKRLNRGWTDRTSPERHLSLPGGRAARQGSARMINQIHGVPDI